MPPLWLQLQQKQMGQDDSKAYHLSTGLKELDSVLGHNASVLKGKYQVLVRIDWQSSNNKNINSKVQRFLLA